jgi:hypothetical protein
MSIDSPRARGGQPEHFQPESAALAVYDGRVCIGHLLRTGPQGVEAYDADSASLGLFPTMDEAAAAVWRRARKQEPQR